MPESDDMDHARRFIERVVYEVCALKDKLVDLDAKTLAGVLIDGVTVHFSQLEDGRI